MRFFIICSQHTVGIMSIFLMSLHEQRDQIDMRPSKLRVFDQNQEPVLISQAWSSFWSEAYRNFITMSSFNLIRLLMKSLTRSLIWSFKSATSHWASDQKPNLIRSLITSWADKLKCFERANRNSSGTWPQHFPVFKNSLEDEQLTCLEARLGTWELE